MFSFTTPQKEVTLGNIDIGGQPGINPTLLFGGLFFKGQPDFKEAEKQMQIMFQMSKETGVPAIPDFFIKKAEHLVDILKFIKKTLDEDAFFSIDVIEPYIKINALEMLHEQNLLHRTIYNSIHVGVTDDEEEALTTYTPSTAILVAFNPKDTSPDGKIEVLENGAHLRDNGLLDIAKNCAIKNILVDTAAMAPGQNSGSAIAALPVIKEEYGLPVGCAIHNVVEKSVWLADYAQTKDIIDIASNMSIPLFGGDFALFGPIHHSQHVFPLIAWQNMLISEYTEQYFGVSPKENHPRRIFYP